MEENLFNLSRLVIQEKHTSKYYIVVRDTIVKCLKGTCSMNVYKVDLGMLVEAIGDENELNLRVKLCTKVPTLCNNEWECLKCDLLSVSPLIWKLLSSVPNLQYRIHLAMNKQFCEEIENIKVGSKVLYYPDPNTCTTYLVTVTFINSVPELGDGYYFGLDLTDYPNICESFLLTNRYFITFNSHGTFTTLNNINPQKNEGFQSVRNFEKNFVFDDILQPKNTDNFFVTEYKDNIDSKRSLDMLRKNKYLLVDAHNNNQVIGHKEYIALNNTNCSTKHIPEGHQNHKKLDKNLLIFDPLNPDNNNLGSLKLDINLGTLRVVSNTYKIRSLFRIICKMDTFLQDIPLIVLEHKWSSDIDLSEKSNLDSETNCSSSSIYNKNYEVEKEQPKNIQRYFNSSDLNLSSYVKVLINNITHYGMIRWIGSPEGSNKLMAAIELDDIHPAATDGIFENVRYFKCNPQKAWFTDIENCHHYDMAASSHYYAPENQDFELIQSSGISEVVPPITLNDNLENIYGKCRGIQGHHNSCYLDATLFSMFAFTSVFDNLLYRPPNENDCPQYEEVQRVLREEIVNPLRKKLFVKAHHVMKLRTLLEKSSSISGLTSEEKDPEEFLTSLVAQTLNAEPFLKLSSGQDAYHYQLFVEKDDNLVFPSVQELLEQSFLTSNIKLKEVPSCLIIQMPRFGKSYKMYSKIQPTLLLDVTDIIEDSPRQCIVCGVLAKYECKECYKQLDQGLQSTTYCSKCLKKAHSHEERSNHKPNTLSVPIEYEMLKEHCPVQRLYLELLAVVCIETSHYVSFVKCAPGSDAPWCFFDSMADRKGEQNGYNIPEIMPCPDFPYWLSKKGASYLVAETDDRILSGYAKRLLCDAYMCIYQFPSTIYK